MEDKLLELAYKYNNMDYFQNDPIIYPRFFFKKFLEAKACLQDIEISGIISAYLAWGRRSLIFRDCERVMEEMSWQPYQYIIKNKFRDDNSSLHRTIKWRDFAKICQNLNQFYQEKESLEQLSVDEIRLKIFGQKQDKNAANKRIHLFRKWMVRDDSKVDIGVWKNINKDDLIIPLDVHVHRTALKLGFTKRKSVNITTALEITNRLKQIFKGDPCLGDYALFTISEQNKINSII